MSYYRHTPLKLRPILCILVLGVSCGCRSEAPYPNRPITLICPWAAGGGTDAVSRQVAACLEQELGVPVNVINATGGAGVTGHSRGLYAKPDGYTITMMTVEISMLHWRRLTDISCRDARPLMMINADAAALFVRSDAPWQSLPELTEAIRREPGKLTASGTSTGGIWHLALAGWLNQIGLKPSDVKWVPMTGAGPSLQDLTGGGLDMVCCSLPEAKTQLLDEMVRCLGVMADERVGGYEQAPTFKEQGSDWAMVGWRGLAVPRDTPDPVALRLEQALKQVTDGKTKVNGQALPGMMSALGYGLVVQPSGEFRTFLAESDEKFGEILTSNEFAAISHAPVNRMAFSASLGAIFVGLLATLALRRMAGSSSEFRLPSASRRGVFNFGFVLLAVVLYLLFAEQLGFVICAGAIFLGLCLALGGRWVYAIPVTLIVVPFIYHAFAHWLRVPLPRGLLGW